MSKNKTFGNETFEDVKFCCATFAMGNALGMEDILKASLTENFSMKTVTKQARTFM